MRIVFSARALRRASAVACVLAMAGCSTYPSKEQLTELSHRTIRCGSPRLDAALAYYRDAIGFTPNGDDRPKGFFDMSAGGTFSHRLACNDWESAGRPQRQKAAAIHRCAPSAPISLRRHACPPERARRDR